MIIELFSGMNGPGVALEQLGVKTRTISFDLEPAAIATSVLNGRAAICEDLTSTNLAMFGEPVKGIWGSPPCFPADTPVLTMRGTVGIQHVEVGDLVLTHKGRWRAVTDTMSRNAPVVAAGWLEATADHRFYASKQERTWIKSERRYEWNLAAPVWTPAADIHERFLAIPISAEPCVVPDPGVAQSEAFWYAVGRWVGDGWTRLVDGTITKQAYPGPGVEPTQGQCPECPNQSPPNKRFPHLFAKYCSKSCSTRASRRRKREAGGIVARHDSYICCAHDEADELRNRLEETGLHWSESKARTTTKFATTSLSLAIWLRSNFGDGAAHKTLPGWTLGLPAAHRSALLSGYIDADGTPTVSGHRTVTVSRNLAFAVRVLATSLGFTTSVTFQTPKRERCYIEGRIVNERPTYAVQINLDDQRYTRADDLHRWVKQRKPLIPTGHEIVYDLTVDEDHSFVAHGFVVHNCQSFSPAGSGGVLMIRVVSLSSSRCAGCRLCGRSGWRVSRSKRSCRSGSRCAVISKRSATPLARS